MEGLTTGAEIVLGLTVGLGIPVAILFLAGCLIQYHDVRRRFASRLFKGNDKVR